MSGARGDDVLAPLRPVVANDLPPVDVPHVAGVLGGHASSYSLSPMLWNAAFQALGLPGRYVAFDVAPERVHAFLDACRAADGLLGLSVTVPYKEQAVRRLDAVDAAAHRAGAVNVIIRTRDGRLIGVNTDGPAAVRALRELRGDAGEAGGTSGLRVLVLGAGGAGRAVALALAETGAEVLLWNRTAARAEDAALAGAAAGVRITVVEGEGLEASLPALAGLVNATTVGMAGAVRTSAGVTWLEPFSPMAPAEGPVLPPEDDGAVPPQRWWEAAWPAVGRNLELSLRRALSLGLDAVMLDLVYVPSETVLLKHARWTGHRAANGERVLVLQAVDAFARLCGPLLASAGPPVEARVEAAMTGAVREAVRVGRRGP